MDTEYVLVTGGLGFIGSHICLELVEKGYIPIIVDNTSTSEIESHSRIELLSNSIIPFYNIDLRSTCKIHQIIRKYDVRNAIHLSALKSVRDSIEYPIEYFDNNVYGLLSLLKAAKESSLRNILFSSSATVYGKTEKCPIVEDSALSAINPYGQSKIMCEDILNTLSTSDSDWKVGILRYFNPVGAHDSGQIGEVSLSSTPANLMPYIAQVALKHAPFVKVYGADYDTPDGTGVRDYIHVMDVAEAHVVAVRHLLTKGNGFTLNLGTGRGTSVLELIEAYKNSSGQDIPYEIYPRRCGDVATSYAAVDQASLILGWHAKRGLKEICESDWKWVNTRNAILER